MEEQVRWLNLLFSGKDIPLYRQAHVYFGDIVAKLRQADALAEAAGGLVAEYSFRGQKGEARIAKSFGPIMSALQAYKGNELEER